MTAEQTTVVGFGRCEGCERIRTTFNTFCAFCRAAKKREAEKQRAGQRIGWTPEEEQELRDLFQATSQDGIALRFGCSKSNVRTAIIRLRLVRAERLSRDRHWPRTAEETIADECRLISGSVKCPRPCSPECRGCDGGRRYHHWIEVSREQAHGPYRCRNCQAEATCFYVWGGELEVVNV